MKTLQILNIYTGEIGIIEYDENVEKAKEYAEKNLKEWVSKKTIK